MGKRAVGVGADGDWSPRAEGEAGRGDRAGSPLPSCLGRGSGKAHREDLRNRLQRIDDCSRLTKASLAFPPRRGASPPCDEEGVCAVGALSCSLAAARKELSFQSLRGGREQPKKGRGKKTLRCLQRRRRRKKKSVEKVTARSSRFGGGPARSTEEGGRPPQQGHDCAQGESGAADLGTLDPSLSSPSA